jgi:hypothetical protein
VKLESKKHPREPVIKMNYQRNVLLIYNDHLPSRYKIKFTAIHKKYSIDSFKTVFYPPTPMYSTVLYVYINELINIVFLTAVFVVKTLQFNKTTVPKKHLPNTGSEGAGII